MTIQLLRSCLLGPTEDLRKLNAGHAGQIVNVPEDKANELLRLGAATKNIVEASQKKA